MFIYKKAIVFAPHLIYPAGKGADILIYNRVQSLTQNIKTVHVISYQYVTVYENGHKVKEVYFPNKQRNMLWAAARTLFSNKTYLYHKLITPLFLEKIKSLLEEFNYDFYYYSFIFSAVAVDSIRKEEEKKLHVIEMHNDDIAWYSNLKKSFVNPLIKLIALNSVKSTISFLVNYGNKYTFIALTERDTQNYLQYIPKKNILVVSAGVDIIKENPVKKNYNYLNIVFIGSLDVKMNYDALLNFAKNYYPILKKKIHQNIQINIAGRNPSMKVKRLCKKYNWQLYPNISESSLNELLLNSHFSILPFEYTTGVKMKLLESFAYGIPVLATKTIQSQITLNQKLENILFSDSGDEWAQFIINYLNKDIESINTDDLRMVAKQYSWKNVNKALIEFIRQNS